MTLKDFRNRYQYNPDQDFLGEGGFSKVYKAMDTQMNREVALKFYHGQGSVEKYGVMEELQKVMSFDHPNLIRYYDATWLDTPDIYDSKSKVQVGIVEYANAGDFNDFMITFPSLKQINKVLLGLFKGLAYLHERGVIHRDIKPSNILMHRTNGEWNAKIADFGLAKKVDNQAASSKLLGTMEYMAPEQFSPKKYGIAGKLGTNVDIWSLGVILYELFTGELPFGSRHDGETHEQVMFAIMQKELGPNLKDVQEPYQHIIRRCLVKKAPERAQTARELVQLLKKSKSSDYVYDQHMVSETVANTPFTQTQRRLLFLGNVIFSPLVSIIGYFVWQRQKQSHKAEECLQIAWWSLAAWLLLLLLIVIGMILLPKLIGNG